MQNNIVRATCLRNITTDKKYQHLKILKIPNLIDYTVLINMYKHQYSLLPNPLYQYFTPNNDTHSYETRNATDPRILQNSNYIVHKSFLVKDPSLWNSLPINLKTKLTLNGFKKSLKEFMLQRQ